MRLPLVEAIHEEKAAQAVLELRPLVRYNASYTNGAHPRCYRPHGTDSEQYFYMCLRAGV